MAGAMDELSISLRGYPPLPTPDGVEGVDFIFVTNELKRTIARMAEIVGYTTLTP